MLHLPEFPMDKASYHHLRTGYTAMSKANQYQRCVHQRAMEKIEELEAYFGDHTLEQTKRWVVVLIARHEGAEYCGVLRKYRYLMDNVLSSYMDLPMYVNYAIADYMDNISLLVSIAYNYGIGYDLETVAKLEKVIHQKNTQPVKAWGSPYIVADTV